MKRFYTLVSTHKEPEGYGIRLDGKPVKTPSEVMLVAPLEALADEIVQEWAAQEENIIPDSMPLTQILITKIDRVFKEREAMTKAVLKYLDTDLLCYRTQEPPELAKLQQEEWDPWLDWFEDRFGAKLQTTTSLSALKQDASAHTPIMNYVKLKSDDEFTVLQLVTSFSGSLVLALAFIEGAITPQQVFNAAHVEENHKAKMYNEDVHGPDPVQEKKQIAMKNDLEAAAKFLALL